MNHPAARANERHSDWWWLAALTLLALATRLYALERLPFDHDEAIHAVLSYRLWQGATLAFDPRYHGPLLYWLNAGVYALLGASDFSARLAPALASSALVWAVWLWRRPLGTWGWRAAALWLVVSPSFVFYGRFLAHDSYAVLLTLLLVRAAMDYGRAGSRTAAIVVGIVVGLLVSTKAVAYIHMGIFVLFGLLVFSMNSFAPAWPRQRMSAWLGRQWRHHKASLALMALAAALVYTALYTSWFRHWDALPNGLIGTLGYWSDQHLSPRLPGPGWYYLPRLALHEPLGWLSLAGLWMVFRRRAAPFDVFLGFWTLAAFAVYSFAQEKVPWLLLHILTPMSLLAGRWLQWALEADRRRRWVALAVALALLWSSREAMWLNFARPAVEPHLLLHMRVHPWVVSVRTLVDQTYPRAGSVAVVGAPRWPLAWYFRDLEAKGTWRTPAGEALFIISDAPLPQSPGEGFRRYRLPFRYWWTPDYGTLLSRELWDYLWRRRVRQPQITDEVYWIMAPSIERTP